MGARRAEAAERHGELHQRCPAGIGEDQIVGCAPVMVRARVPAARSVVINGADAVNARIGRAASTASGSMSLAIPARERFCRRNGEHARPGAEVEHV